MSQQDPFPTAKFHEEIGRLCLAWAFLEVMLQHTIWNMLNIGEDMGKYVTYSLDAKRRWELACELAEARDKELHKRLKSNNARMAQLTVARNLAVHGVLARDPKTKVMGWIVYKGAKAGKLQPASEQFVIETRTGIQDLVKRILPHLVYEPEPPTA